MRPPAKNRAAGETMITDIRASGDPPPEKFLVVFFLGALAVIGAVWILLSDGFYPVDECAHYLYSRFVLSALPVTVQTWNRPGALWLFALPAQLGHTLTMFFCLTLFLCLLVVTYRIAVLMKI